MEWATPQVLYDQLHGEFNFDLDVAANKANAKCKTYFSKKQNGLKQDWYASSINKSIYCNPPYGRGVDRWLEKAWQTSQQGATVVVLIPFRSDTKYFLKYVYSHAAELRMISGRLKFNDAGGTAPFPSVVVVYRPGQHKLKYSMMDTEGNYLNGLQNDMDAFAAKVQGDLEASVRHDKRSIEKLAGSFGITDKTEVKELTELAIVKRARDLALMGDTALAYQAIVNLYNNQVNLSHRTSQSILLQQYSTPAPIGYLMGIFCRINEFDTRGGYGFEPSAGNGLLTIAGTPRKFIVNEIDSLRNRNLQTQQYFDVLSQDATEPFTKYHKTFDAVLTNPPFGKLEQKININGFQVYPLEHIMAIRALDTMKDSGRAAIIIGGHTVWDEHGRIRAGKNRIFFNYLYHHYHVLDVIMIDGKKLYSRQGTGFNTRLILIAGRKNNPAGAAPLHNPQHDHVVRSFDELYNRVMTAKKYADAIKPNMEDIRQKAIELRKRLNRAQEDEDLGAVYVPASDACVKLETEVPDSMSFEIHEAINRIKEEAGGDIDNLVRHRLGYRTKKELCEALSAEQIDAVAMAIYNIEVREQGMVVGDQTGIGKGRIAAAMIRYGVQQGLKPIFITEKANLFSDIYRDLAAIGSAHLKPFIVNGRESKTDIKDQDGDVVYQALSPGEQETVFKSNQIPSEYNYVVATYSQFNSPKKKPAKPYFLYNIAEGNLLIMDESHNASGSSNTGEFLRKVTERTKGVIFLSATFAKRPDNMPIYAMKTAMQEANMSSEGLVEAITRGGVALQEVLSSQLVAEGQMIRRERSYEGIEVNYITLEDSKIEHSAICDNITQTLRDIIAFQKTYIDKEVKEMDKVAAAEGMAVEERKGTSQAGVDNTPYFSKIFNVVNQMLFSIKAEAVADRAIARLREGKKPVIAFSSTMGSFIEQLETEPGKTVGDGDTINGDFSEVLRRGLDSVMRYTVFDIDGTPSYHRFDFINLPAGAMTEYFRILAKIDEVATGISISPIDVLTQRLEQAGYTVAEVTGRKYQVQFSEAKDKGIGTVGVVLTRKRENTNDAFRRFNNNEVDVLLINQSGSTGASAHAIATNKVEKNEVKQRVMLVLQPELDINTEVQKRGRINRTGQIIKPIYDYVISAIPAEQRLMMMLQKKLKSLDANTTSNQRQSSAILNVPDFLNKYGDTIVYDYLKENPELNDLLNDPLGFEKDEDEWSSGKDNAAAKVSGRVAVLSTKMQEEFYQDIIKRYDEHIEYLKQVDEYDLEVETLDLQAKTLATRIIKMGKGGFSSFSQDSELETVEVNILKKPYTVAELENMLVDTVGEANGQDIAETWVKDYEAYISPKQEQERADLVKKYEDLVNGIQNEKQIVAIKDKQGENAWSEAVMQRHDELQDAKEDELKKLDTRYHNRAIFIKRIMRAFYPGRMIYYPAVSFDAGKEVIMGVCLGIGFDKTKKYPYAPSSYRVKLAISNGTKFIAASGSHSELLLSIMGLTTEHESDRETILERWGKAIKDRIRDRGTRHIIVGNILQAFSDFRGKLVSYTTNDGSTRKGILLHEGMKVAEKGDEKIIVPILAAVKIIRSIPEGVGLHADQGISFFRKNDTFKIVVPASRKAAGDIFLDPQLLDLVDGNNFQKVSTSMVATLPADSLPDFIRLLQVNHNVSLTISASQRPMLEPVKLSSINKKLELPPPEEKHEPKVIQLDILKLKAKALKLKLRMAA